MAEVKVKVRIMAVGRGAGEALASPWIFKMSAKRLFS